MKLPKKWKTNTGAFLVANWPIVRHVVEVKYPEYVIFVDAAGALGASLMGVGIAHRAEKNGIAAPGVMVGRAVKKVG